LEARVFHAQDRASVFKLRFGFPVSSAELIELDGRVAAKLAVMRDADGGSSVSAPIPAFGLRTVRVTPAGRLKPIQS
jgi:hypothetical protein